jgi:cardiolipin synthase
MGAGAVCSGGFSDGLDGLLARTLKQQTVLGQYLDPIADKLLLSTMFMVLAIFAQDCVEVHRAGLQPRHIDSVCQRGALRDCRTARFPPSIFGKANTFAQVAAIFFVMLFQIKHARWIWLTQTTFLHATVAFTVVSAVHYVYLVGQRLHGRESRSCCGHEIVRRLDLTLFPVSP